MDTTMLILKMLQQMGEQRRADLQVAQKQRLAAEERRRRDMQRMLQELQMGRTSAITCPLMEHFPSLKNDFNKLSGEPED